MSISTLARFWEITSDVKLPGLIILSDSLLNKFLSSSFCEPSISSGSENAITVPPEDMNFLRSLNVPVLRISVFSF